MFQRVVWKAISPDDKGFVGGTLWAMSSECQIRLVYSGEFTVCAAACYRAAGIQGCRGAGVQGCRGTEVQGYTGCRGTGIQGYIRHVYCGKFTACAAAVDPCCLVTAVLVRAARRTQETWHYFRA